MAFSGLKITDLGKEALANAQNGAKMEFLYAAIGDGKTPVIVEGLSNLLFKLPLGNIQIEKNLCIIEADLNNANLDQGYYLREIGIYVKVNDQEILYVYDNAGESAEYIPANGPQASIEKRLRFSLEISDVQDISIEAESVLYATKKELEEHLESIIEISDLEIDLLDDIDPDDPPGESISNEEIDNILNN